MPAKMKSTAWEQGFWNLPICAVGVLVFHAIITVVVALVFHKSAGDAIAIAYTVLWVFFDLAFLAACIYGRATAGPVLLDCGRHPIRLLFLIAAIILLLDGVAGWISGRSSAAWYGVSGPVFLISFAAFFFIIATGRLQVREKGLWQYWGLLRWSKIGSYHWDDDSNLLLRPKGFLGLLRGALFVPPKHKQAVAELLARHCPAQPTAEAAAATDGPCK